MLNTNAIFFGHWSPMNAIIENNFSNYWKILSKKIKKPKAILSISAHFESDLNFLTANNSHDILYDFYWFPKKLYDVNFKIKWSEILALEIQKNLKDFEINLDYNSKIDHWIWSIYNHFDKNLKDVPLLSLSINSNFSFEQHIKLARKLKVLKSEWYLIIWSWNFVHNLKQIDWHNPKNVYSWALEFNNDLKEIIKSWNLQKLSDMKKHKYFKLSHPTLDHFIPIIYILALKEENEEIIFFNDEIELWSLSMTSFYIKNKS